MRHVSSNPVTLQRFLRFGPVVTRGVTLDIEETLSPFSHLRAAEVGSG